MAQTKTLTLTLGTGMGYVGAALASSISTWLQFLFLLVYIAYFKVRLCKNMLQNPGNMTHAAAVE